MKFLVVDRIAAEDLISNRQMQSSNFPLGEQLSKFLASGSPPESLGPFLVVNSVNDGFIITSRRNRVNDLLVFDLEQAPLFTRSEHREVLLFFQKATRFAIRYWKNQRLTPAERMIPGSSKAVVFPYPVSQQTSVRITIERAPDPKRAARRTEIGNNLLVYKCSTTEGEGPSEKPSVTNYRKALAAFKELRHEFQKENIVVSSDSGITSFNVTELEETSRRSKAGLTYELWMRDLLTTNQRQFAEQPLETPQRIEGPAGTGKTLCLVLKAITTLRASEDKGVEHRALFVAHSESTRKNIEQLFEVTDDRGFMVRDRLMSLQSIRVTTLQELCGELLGSELSEAEFLDRDAFDSKQVQLLYADEVIGDAMKEDFPTHRVFMSGGFSAFLDKSDKWELAQMLQHEISVVIKGRGEGDYEKYKTLPILKYGLPVKTEEDKAFVYVMYKKYQERLEIAGQFDTDDIVLSAMGQLNTPIWRRRRTREGFDSIFVDETHLFNINELSVFHYINKLSSYVPIAYSVDRSQAIGDMGWTPLSFQEIFREVDCIGSETTVQDIFRSSPDIVNLAWSVTASGASLFTNFDDPLSMANSAFTEEEERRSALPCFLEYPNDDEMIKAAFSRAERMVSNVEGERADVAVILFSEELFSRAASFAAQHNKPTEILRARGDVELVNRARKTGRFVLGTPDVIGGLEFSGVILVGVEKGRVPPSKSVAGSESSHFLNYASHNRLYVAITRAKYRVEVLVTQQRGLSPLFDCASRDRLIAKSS